MNRHDRRRQAKIVSRSKFFIIGEFFCCDHLIELLDQSPTIALTLGSMLAELEGDRPPLCGGCGTALTVLAPPASYLLLHHSGLLLHHSGTGEQRLSGVCLECISGDPEALRQRVARALGLEPLSAAHLHYGIGGRA